MWCGANSVTPQAWAASKSMSSTSEQQDPACAAGGIERGTGHVEEDRAALPCTSHLARCDAMQPDMTAVSLVIWLPLPGISGFILSHLYANKENDFLAVTLFIKMIQNYSAKLRPNLFMDLKPFSFGACTEISKLINTIQSHKSRIMFLVIMYQRYWFETPARGAITFHSKVKPFYKASKGHVTVK